MQVKVLRLVNNLNCLPVRIPVFDSNAKYEDSFGFTVSPVDSDIIFKMIGRYLT